jgi:hypothetical protein
MVASVVERWRGVAMNNRPTVTPDAEAPALQPPLAAH